MEFSFFVHGGMFGRSIVTFYEIFLLGWLNALFEVLIKFYTNALPNGSKLAFQMMTRSHIFFYGRMNTGLCGKSGESN